MQLCIPGYYQITRVLERFKHSHWLNNERISLYTFRHTYATMLIDKELNNCLIADSMGHVCVKSARLENIQSMIFTGVLRFIYCSNYVATQVILAGFRQ